MEAKIVFPCGYRAEFKTHWYDFGFGEIGGECPLHGKDCNKEKQGVNIEKDSSSGL